MKRNKTIPAGKVVEAKLASHAPSFIRPSKMSESRKAGLRYEAKAQIQIEKVVELARTVNPQIKALQSPWLVFRAEQDAPDFVRYCQPDTLIFDDEALKLTIIEIKLQHCLEAYEQVRLLYEPVLRFMYPQYEIAAIEWVLWHDPHVQFPERFYFEPNVIQAEPGKFGIHIWNPRYDKTKSANTSNTPASATRPTNRTPPLG